MKALACTAPLHDLDARSRASFADAERYQMAEIGLQAIDEVTLAMDFDHGAAQPEARAPVAAVHRGHRLRTRRWPSTSGSVAG